MNDSVFNINSGCEGPGRTNYGIYYIKSDSLFLKDGIPDLPVKIIKTDSLATKENLLVLRFFDQNGENITGKFSAFATRLNDGNHYSLSYDSVRKVLINRKTGEEMVHISTLELLGCVTEQISMNFPEGKEIDFHLHIPEIVTELNLFNKDIRSGGTTVYKISTDCLISTMEEPYEFSETGRRNVIFAKDTRKIQQ